jgi:predicted ATPase
MDEEFNHNLPISGVTQPIAISLFGVFSLHVNGQPIDSFRSSKARAMFAYLLMTRPQPLLRATLVELLWPDYAVKSAWTSLRQTLANIRTNLKPFAILQADRQYVHLTVDPASVWCDVLQFEALLDACQRHTHASQRSCPICQKRLHQALALYKGSFLENLPVVDSPPFNDWLDNQRSRFAAQVAALQTMLATPAQPDNLPRPLTSLIGRSADLRELTEKVLHPVYRCLTLIGPGGIGKTRLAIALGEQLRANFAQGCWFVALAALPPESQDATDQTERHDRIATAISAALGLTLQGANRPTQQVIGYLHDKTLLLILDNFEHLSTGADWLVALLQAAPNVRLLVTSRHRLPMQAQLVYPVTGLALPPEQVEESRPAAQPITQFASLQLFIERAENAFFPFQRNASNLMAISTLCRLLEGSPLGIELAVPLLESQSPSAILHAVRTHYTALQANLSDLPQRQRSAAAVLQTAWELLNAQEAQTLARCAVFRGGFTATAAQRIIDAQPAALESLVNKSLVHFSANNTSAEAGRYTLHELVRQFAAEHSGFAHFENGL